MTNKTIHLDLTLPNNESNPHSADIKICAPGACLQVIYKSTDEISEINNQEKQE
jgi:hypothetical protein